MGRAVGALEAHHETAVRAHLHADHAVRLHRLICGPRFEEAIGGAVLD
jgi:hypothetical protein